MDEIDRPTSLKFRSENRALQEGVASMQILYEQILKLPEWLEGLESPFTWGLSFQFAESVKWNIPGKICDYENQGAFYGFERLAFLLTMIFLKTIHEEMARFLLLENNSNDSEDSEGEDQSEADRYKPTECYRICKETFKEMAENKGDIMYTRIGPALEHVLKTTLAHVLFFDGQIEESKKVAAKIQRINKMSQECKAGLEGLKAKVVMSMVQNYTIVLPYLHKAMELDPGFGYWPYLTGKVLRRARREFDDGSIDEEFKFFEKAVSLERNPKFLVFLGQAYQETAMSIFHSREQIPFRVATVDRLNQKAVELYRECWRLKNDSAAISRRVGNGMSKMRSDLIDKTVAKEALLKAIELSPNECTHLSLGKFYYMHEMNDEKALEHFHKFHPSDFGTAEIIRLNLIKDPNYDPIDVLQPWLELNVNAVKQYRVFSDAAWYYLVFKKDLKSATKYIWRILVKDHKFIRAKRVVEYKSYAFCVDVPVNLIEILVNEILLLKEKKESLSQDDKIALTELENVLEKLFEKYPDLRNMTPTPNLLDDLKRNVDKSIAIKRRRRYQSGHSRRSEHSRQVEEPGSWRNNRLSQGSQQTNDENQNRQQEGPFNQRYNQRQSANNNGSNMRNSFSGGVEERNNGRYNMGEGRRNSESQSSWRSERTSNVGEGNSNPNEANYRGNNNRQCNTHNNRGNNDRQYNTNNNRYDVTVTNWRSENRNH